MALSQGTYARTVLDRFDMLNCNPVKTPMDPGILKTLTKPGNGLDESTKDRSRYQQAMGSLLYLATCTRPDISFAVSKLSQYNQEPKDIHWKLLNHLFKYVKGTMDLGIQYSGKHELDGYSDSDYAMDPVERKSTGGYIFLVNHGPVSWSSKKMVTIATSTMEAEYMAMSIAAKQAIWIHRLMINLGTSKRQNGALVQGDNAAEIRLAPNVGQ
jgi:hypothetical protein